MKGPINPLVRAGMLDFTDFTSFLLTGKPTPEQELAGDTSLLERQYCEICEEQIYPDVCWCGDSLDDHSSLGSNHGFVPYGCVCYETTDIGMRDAED